MKLMKLLFTPRERLSQFHIHCNYKFSLMYTVLHRWRFHHSHGGRMASSITPSKRTFCVGSLHLFIYSWIILHNSGICCINLQTNNLLILLTAIKADSKMIFFLLVFINLQVNWKIFPISFEYYFFFLRLTDIFR